MKKILSTLGIAAIIALGSCQSSTDNSTSSGNEAINNIMTRTSVRNFTDEAVTDAQIETMLRAAMAAPTAINKQPWEFIVVKDKNTLKAFADSAGLKPAAGANIAIVVCGNMTQAIEGEGRDYWIHDVSAATENLLLAAHAQGLGAVWCGGYPSHDRAAFVSKTLNLPDEIIPLSIVPIGVPAGEHQPKDKWKPNKIHYERWNKE